MEDDRAQAVWKTLILQMVWFGSMGALWGLSLSRMLEGFVVLILFGAVGLWTDGRR